MGVEETLHFSYMRGFDSSQAPSPLPTNIVSAVPLTQLH
jgi:hypothetical protein